MGIYLGMMGGRKLIEFVSFRLKSFGRSTKFLVALRVFFSMFPSNYWKNYRLPIFSKLHADTACVLVMFSVHAALAQSSQGYSLVAPGMPQPWVSQNVVHHSTAYCRQSTLSSVAFMKLVQSVVAHGDLTDIAFIQKSLDTKFSFTYGWKEDGTADTQTFYYDTNEVLGNPIHVKIRIWSKAKQKEIDIADMSFQSQSFPGSENNFIRDCLNILPSDFISFFGGRFVASCPCGLSPEMSENQLQGTPGKNGTRLYLSIDYSSENKIIDGIEILQK